MSVNLTKPLFAIQYANGKAGVRRKVREAIAETRNAHTINYRK